MKRVVRYDAGTLQSPRKTPQGYLHVDGWAARIGILEYRNPDGSIRRELREDGAVFADSSLEGYLGAAVTDDHPAVMVDAANDKILRKGTVLSVGRRDGDHVAVQLQITDPDLIRKMQAGKRQLSAGYYVELDETPGFHPQFGRYDAKQVKVGPVNHLAVVERGRAGTAAVRMDAADETGALVEIINDEEVETRLDAEWDESAYPRDGYKTDEAEARLNVIAERIVAFKSKKDSALDLHNAKHVPNYVSVMTLTEALARITELEAKLDALEAAPAQDGVKCEKCGAMNPAGATECEKCGAPLAAPAPAEKTDSADLARLEVERDLARKDAEDAKTAHATELEKVRKDAEDAKTAHATELEKVRKDADKLRRDSLDVLVKASAVLGKDATIKLDGKDVALVDAPLKDVKVAVIKQISRLDVAGKPESYIDAAFDMAVNGNATATASLAAAQVRTPAPGATETRVDAEPNVDPEVKAAADLKNSISSAWMATETK